MAVDGAVPEKKAPGGDKEFMPCASRYKPLGRSSTASPDFCTIVDIAGGSRSTGL